MVRVPGSLGDSGFHRESAEDVQVKKESGEEALSEHGSTKTLLNETRSADRQSTGRNSVDGNEGDLETDLEDKPQLPPQVPLGTPVGLDESRDSLTKQTKAGSARYAFADSPIKLEPGSDQHDFSKTAQGAATPRRKMKGPDLEKGDKKGSDSRWLDVALEFAYNRQEMQKFIDRDPVLQILRPKQISMPKGPIVAPTISDNKLDLIKGLMNLLKEAGLVASPFDANELFDLDLKVIQSSIKTAFIERKALVGEIPSYRHPTVPDPVSSPQIGSTRYQTALPYLSAAAPGSDGSSELQRMPRRLPGAAMLESRSDTLRQERPRSRSRKPRPTSTDRTVRTTRSEESTSRFECYFQTAMSRSLKEQHQATAPSAAVKAIKYVESHEEEMKSTGSRDPDPSRWEYDPDENDRPIPARTAVATTTTGPPASSTIQQIRISAISDLKEFTGRDQDEDRARSWISKVKSALLRDRATDEEKCLTFADLLTGPAKNWYRQLSRSTRNKWSDLLCNFQIQYCGLGVSRIWQYYQSRKKSDESPLEYLYRLNVAALRARLKIKDGNPKTRREHVENFMATVGNPDLADQLTLLRLADADDLEEVLRARERAKSRQSRSAFGSKNPQKVLSLAPTTSIKRPVYAVHIAARESESDTESDGSDSEGTYAGFTLRRLIRSLLRLGVGPQRQIKCDMARSATIHPNQTINPAPSMMDRIAVAAAHIASLGNTLIVIVGSA
ncbi:hypothetical protein PF003_g30692 [Phytophthora fragariae]|nr:hypothetical protein PF003_g30692 [Phytophthora fragariae]